MLYDVLWLLELQLTELALVRQTLSGMYCKRNKIGTLAFLLPRFHAKITMKLHYKGKFRFEVTRLKTSGSAATFL